MCTGFVQSSGIRARVARLLAAPRTVQVVAMGTEPNCLASDANQYTGPNTAPGAVVLMICPDETDFVAVAQRHAIVCHSACSMPNVSQRRWCSLGLFHGQGIRAGHQSLFEKGIRLI